MNLFPSPSQFCVSALSALLGLTVLLAGCAQTATTPARTAASKAHPAVGHSLRIRTTAYTGSRNAIGTRLSHGAVTSAASDWSEFPLGTRFRLRATGQVYEIDDYGSALVGTRTIDLCMPGSRAMHSWGVRWVEIEILRWGSPRKSLEVLLPREKTRNARRMLVSLRSQTQGVPEKFHRVEM